MLSLRTSYLAKTHAGIVKDVSRGKRDTTVSPRAIPNGHLFSCSTTSLKFRYPCVREGKGSEQSNLSKTLSLLCHLTIKNSYSKRKNKDRRSHSQTLYGRWVKTLLSILNRSFIKCSMFMRL